VQVDMKTWLGDSLLGAAYTGRLRMEANVKRALVLIAGCAVVMGCAHADDAPTSPPATTPLPTFEVAGIVRDTAGAALPGTLVEIINSSLGSVLSDEAGYFRIAGVRGRVTLWVWKDGYTSAIRNLTVNADQSVEVVLRDLAVEFEIVLGRTIRSYVPEVAPPCDASRWDERAPCRRFRFTAPYSGTLDITITWNGAPALDAVIVSPQDTYLARSEQSGVDEISLRAFVQAGATYEVRVHSYYDEKVFNLRADLRP